MSFLGIRQLTASCSRSVSRSSVQSTPRTPFQVKRFSSTEPPPARHPIGRIIPKRIAVRVPRQSADEVPQQTIWQPIVFCLALGGGGYLLAAQYTNSDTEAWSQKLGAGKWWRRGQEQPSDREITRAKVLEEAKHAQQVANQIPKTLSFLPTPVIVPILRIYVMTKEYMLNTPPAQLVPLQIIAGMGVVFLGWKIHGLEPWMRRWWLHRPVVLGGAKQKWAETVTLFTSVLSHQSLPHFAFNSIALSSFGAAAYSYIASPPPSSEIISSSTHTPHFLAFLLAAGLTSSLASHLYTNIFRLPRLIRSIQNPARLSSPQALASQQAILPSLGASGAIYAALTLTACAYPETSVGIIFVPFISFPIGLGVCGMVAVDVIGLLRGWRLFDHVAHLGGAVFGVVYYQYGREAWVWLRKKLGASTREIGWF